MLLRLTANMDSTYENIVISLTDLGQLGAQLEEQGIEVLTLGTRNLLDFPLAFLKLRKILNCLRPDIVQTWMYHSDFLGGLAARSVGIKNVVWNVRNTNLGGRGLGNYWFRRLCAFLSYLIPRRILYVSDSAKLVHEQHGYCSWKSQVIYNGFDLERFRFHKKSRTEIRKYLGMSENDFVICSVGRFVPEKDHVSFIKAVRELIESGTDVRALMVGRGIGWDNQEIVKQLNGVEQHFRLVGPQKEVQEFLSCADLFCLHSTTEGFPNVLGEAMAVGLPCVTTRAGDAGKILNCRKFTVDAGDYVRLADAFIRMRALSFNERKALGKINRETVERNFSLKCTVTQFEQLYRSLRDV